MALRLYAATTSQGKLRDFRAAAEAHALSIEPLPGLKIIPAPEENGLTFSENARLKAVYYSRFAPGELVLADDSGLTDSPDANDNTDVWNNIVLLQRLVGVPPCRRTARYRSVLAVARDGEVLHTAEGEVGGLILGAPRGMGGFGYDPLFYLPALQLTMAEIDLETKNTLSHRGRAIQELLPKLGL